MNVLVVEDEAIVAMEIEQILAGAGYTIVGIADHQREAIAIAKASRPDMALVDVRLADGESGVDVAAALQHLGVPAMFVTGTCPRADGAGIALACLHKPFSERGLLDSVAVLRALIAGQTPTGLPPTLHLYDPPSQGGFQPA